MAAKPKTKKTPPKVKRKPINRRLQIPGFTTPDAAWFAVRSKEVGLSQRKLAGAIGLDPSSFNRSLRGDRRWQLEDLLGMCEALDVSAAELLPRIGFPPTSGGVPIIGTLRGDGVVSFEGSEHDGTFAVQPPEAPPLTRAFVADTAHSPLDRVDQGIYYVAHRDTVDVSVLGRLCFVEYGDPKVTVFATITRASARGKFIVRENATNSTLKDCVVSGLWVISWVKLPQPE